MITTPVPKDHPLMKAWEAHKATEEYANSKRWAASPQDVDGSLWALFSAGWNAGVAASHVADDEETEEVICASCDGNGRDFSRATGTFTSRCTTCGGSGLK